jgi:hypothetical protein
MDKSAPLAGGLLLAELGVAMGTSYLGRFIAVVIVLKRVNFKLTSDRATALITSIF